MFLDRRVQLKKPAEIALMRRAGLVVADTLAMLREAVAPGVTTGELDLLAEERIRSSGAVPSFQGYLGYPASICTSVNDEVVHGIPGA
ncbi:MAG: M24 family metallopeptidase, partial [Actinopolymorphaceae bacterium]